MTNVERAQAMIVDTIAQVEAMTGATGEDRDRIDWTLEFLYSAQDGLKGVVTI